MRLFGMTLHLEPLVYRNSSFDGQLNHVSIGLQKIFEAFASRKGIAVTSLSFRLDGDRVTGDQTPKMLELEDNDQIDVNLEMVRINVC